MNRNESAYQEAPDEALMAAYQAGEMGAFDALYARYESRIFNYLLRQTGDPEMAEDVFQEVFLRLHRSRRDYDPARPFSNWIFTIAANLVKTAFRRRQVRSVERGEAGIKRFEGGAAADARAVGRETEERIQTALEALRGRTVRAVYRAAVVEQAEDALTLRRLGVAVGAGVLAGLVFTYVLSRRGGLEALSAVQLTATATLWSGLLVAAFCWMLGRYRQWGVQWGMASVLGVAATGLSLVGALLCPGETFFSLWTRSAPAEALNGVFGAAVGYLIFGVGYALLPAFVASVALGKRLRGRLGRNGTVSAGLFVLLLAPAAYLQCGPLATGLFGMWTLGAILGAAGGVFGGLEIRRAWPRRASV